MIKHFIHNWNIFVLGLTLIGLALPANAAEQIRVKKVKGNSAVIETDIPLEEGKTYELADEKFSANVDYKSNTLKVRSNSLSFGTDFEYVRSELSQNTAFNLNLRYGWNFSSLEVGITTSLQSRDQGAGNTSSVLVGGYFDYNMVANRDPRDFIYGGFILLATGSTQYPSSTAGGSTTKIESNAGGFMTYFLGDSNTAIRGELFYNYQQINTTVQQNSIAGAGFRGLLVLYF
jgi:hypothetical protein